MEGSEWRVIVKRGLSRDRPLSPSKKVIIALHDYRLPHFAYIRQGQGTVVARDRFDVLFDRFNKTMPNFLAVSVRAY